MAKLHQFPVLDVHSITECLTELGCSITAEALSNPTGREIRVVYEHLVETCMGIIREDLQLPFHVLERLEHPELHERSFPNIILYRHLAKLVRVCGVREFSLQDLVQPEARRTHFILSAIINFEKFRVDRINHFSRYQQETEELAEARAAAETRHQALSSKLDKVRLQVEAEASAAAALQAKLGLVQEASTVLADRRETVRLAAETMTARSELLLARAEVCATTSNSARSCNADMNARLVPPPNELRKVLVELSQNVENLKKENQASNGVYRELQGKYDVLEKVSGSLNKRKTTLEDLTTELARIRKMSKDLKEYQETIESAGVSIKEIEAHEEHLKGQINEIYDKSTRQKKQFEYKKRRAQLALDEVGLQKAQLLREQDQERQKMAQLENAVARKQHEISELREAHEKVVSQARQKFDHLGQTLNSYHSALYAQMKA